MRRLRDLERDRRRLTEDHRARILAGLLNGEPLEALTVLLVEALGAYSCDTDFAWKAKGRLAALYPVFHPEGREEARLDELEAQQGGLPDGDAVRAAIARRREALNL